MRHLLKSFIISAATVYIVYLIVPTIDFGPDPQNLLIFVGGLWIISQVISPIFSIVLLPINILTFGLVSMILNVAFVFALINYLPGFAVGAFDFQGALIYGVILPAMAFNEITTIILVSVIITLLQKLSHIIFE